MRVETAGSKISLLYDSVRELLEAVSLRKGFKIYNHVCYVSFLKEVMMVEWADEFDDLRIVRNDINYYGKELSVDDAEVIVTRLEKVRQDVLTLL